MDEDYAILARTDAAFALLVNVLIEKGIVSRSEMYSLLVSAADSVRPVDHGGTISSVFTCLSVMLGENLTH
jgi:hypothetical protein